MAAGKINFKLIIVLFIAVIVAVGTGYGLRKYFRSSNVVKSFEQGNLAYNEKKWDEAAEKLGSYLAVKGDDIDILMKYADAQLKRRPQTKGNIEQASSALRSVLRIDENNEKASQQFIDLYIDLGGYYEAQMKAEDFLKNNESSEIRLKLISSLIGQRKFKEASQHISSLIEKHPDYVPTYEIAAAMSMQRPEDFSETAQYWLDLAVKNNPQSALAYISRGSYQIQLKNTAEGIADFQKAQSLSMESTMMLRLAKEYVIAEDYAAAVKILDEIKSKYLDNVEYWQVRSLIAIRLNDSKKVVQTAKDAMENLGYNFWDFMPAAIEMLIDGDDIASAEKYIERMSEMENRQTQILFFKGLISYKQNKKSEAIKLWKESIELGFKTPRIRMSLSAAYADIGNLSSAVGQLRLLLSDMPNNFDARLNLAKLLLQTDDFAGAAEQSQLAVQLRPYSEQALNIYLQSKMQLLSSSGISKDSQEWMELEERISTLDKGSQDRPDLLLRHLQLNIQTGKIDNAQEKLKLLKEKYPDSLEFALGEIDLEMSLDNTADIESRLKTLIEKYPSQIEPIKYLLVFYNKQQRTDDMVKLLQDGIKGAETEKYKIQFALLLADISIGSAHHQQALNVLNETAQHYPQSIILKRKQLSFKEIYEDAAAGQSIINEIKNIEGANGWQWRYEQAKFYLLSKNSKENTEQIINLLKEALVAEPSSIECRLLLGSFYSQLGDNNSAVSVYRQAIARWPDNPDVVASLVAALYRTNEFEQAEALLKRASEKNLSSESLEKLQTQNMLRGGDYEGAGAILEKRFAKDNKDFDTALTLALISIRQGAYQKAQDIINDLKLKFPDTAALAFAEVELNVRQGNLEQALAFCNSIVEKQNSVGSYLLRGRTNLLLAKTEDAEKDFLKAVEIEPKNPQVWMSLVSFYKMTKKESQAIATVEKAIETIPDNVQMLRRAIITFGSSDNYEIRKKSGLLIDKALSILPDDPELLMLKARYLISEANTGSYEKANTILLALTSNYPNYADAWLILSQLTVEFGHSDKALDYTEQGLLYSPENKSLLLFKARMLIMRSPARATEMLEKLYKQYPQDLDIVLSYGDVLIRSGKSENAVEVLTCYIQKESAENIISLKLLLATALAKSGKANESQSIFDALSADKSNESAVYVAKSRIFIDQQNWLELVNYTDSTARRNKQMIPVCMSIASQLCEMPDINARKTAEDVLTALNKIDSANVEVMGMLGIVLQRNGRSSESAAYYKKIIEAQPDNTVALNNLAWILCEEQGAYEQALALTEKGVKLSPTYEDIYDTRGVIYYRIGQYENAIKDFNKAIELIPAGNLVAASAYFHLGRTYFDMNEKAKALENLNKAIDLDGQAKVLSVDDLAQARKLVYQLNKN